MKHFEFDAYLAENETVKVPAEVAAQIERDRPVHVVVLVPDSAEGEQWAELTTEKFLEGYAASDAIYDDVSGG